MQFWTPMWFVSALLKNGSVPWQVVEEALHGDIIPVINDEILAEYEEVLNRPKFKFEKRSISVLLSEVKKRAVYAEAGLIEDIVPDPKDVVFYAVLMEKRKEEEAYLVTGNLKHYPIKTYVVTAREMLDILLEAEREDSESDKPNNDEGSSEESGGELENNEWKNAVSAILDEAHKVAQGEGEYYSYDDVFGDQQEE